MKLNGSTEVGRATRFVPTELGGDAYVGCARIDISGPGLVRRGVPTQFDAFVTGLANTGVTWAATGGTITSTGVYTANRVGAFRIIAVSREDPSIFASVNITVSDPPLLALEIVSDQTGDRPSSPVLYRATVTGLPGTTVEWTTSMESIIFPNGFFPGPVNQLITGFSVGTPAAVDPSSYRVEATLTYSPLVSTTNGLRLQVSACVFRQGRPVNHPFSSVPVCSTTTELLLLALAIASTFADAVMSAAVLPSTAALAVLEYVGVGSNDAPTRYGPCARRDAPVRALSPGTAASLS